MQGLVVRGVLIAVFCATTSFAADRMRIGYSSISGAYVGIWVAHDAGLFAKEGLDDQIILIPNGTQLAQVTVAGEVDIASLGGAAGISAALSGADFKIIGNNVNKLVFSMYARPEIKRVEDLKGKKIGITRYGTSADISVQPVTRFGNTISTLRRMSFYCSWELSARLQVRSRPGRSRPAWSHRPPFS